MRRSVVLAAGACAATVAAVPGVAVAESVRCDGVLGGTINANVVVPRQADCRLQEATVNGNVRVKSTGGLIVEGSEVNGNLRGSGAEYWGFTDSNGGDVTVINGNVELVETTSNPMAAMAPDSMSRFNFACEGTEFASNVSIRGSAGLADFLFGSPDGGANMMRAPDLNMQVGECSEGMMDDDGRDGNFVAGNYEALGNRGEVRQRDNDVDGHFSLFGNAAATPMDDIDVLRNAVGRYLTCQGNVPEPYQEGNTEADPQRGEEGDQCPAP